jgi:hypothetical protein
MGLEFGVPVRKLLAIIIRQGGSGGVMSAPGPESEAARTWVREQFAKELRPELRAEIERELRDELVDSSSPARSGMPVAPLALPAAGETEVRELEHLAEPRQALRVFPERQPQPVADAEVVSGEVIADEPRYAWPQARVVSAEELRAQRRGSRRNRF